MNDAITIPQATTTQINKQLLFASVRPTADYEEGDGKELGLLIFYRLHPLRRREDELRSEINVLVGQITVLREAKAQHEWLDELLFYIIRNKLRPLASCKVKLANITREDAAKLGGALASLLVYNVTAVAAVDEWIVTTPALTEMDTSYVRERSKRKNTLLTHLLRSGTCGSGPWWAGSPRRSSLGCPGGSCSARTSAPACPSWTWRPTRT